jgi:hypothetical protein
MLTILLAVPLCVSCDDNNCEAASTCAIACPRGMSASDVCQSGKRVCVCVPDGVVQDLSRPPD